ncbi:MAG: hypothetical protein H7333_11930, partial [Bdellovibrionales bacterium]|nr:hypothetical protein [Oligoflexia bacterium]
MKKVILSSVLIMATAFPVYAQQPIDLIQRQKAALVESIQRQFLDTGSEAVYFGTLDWNFATLGLPSPGHSLKAALEGKLHDFSEGENQKTAFHVGKDYYLYMKLMDFGLERDALTSKELFFGIVAQKVR